MGYSLSVYSPSDKEAQEKVRRQNVAEGRGEGKEIRPGCYFTLLMRGKQQRPA